MIITAVDYILTVMRDDLPSNALPWTQSVQVATAMVRKQGNCPPQDITKILSNFGWVTQSSSEHSVELIGVRDAISMPKVPLLDSLFDLLDSDVPADTEGLLDWWWANALTVARVSIAYFAVLGVSGDDTVVDIRSFSLPSPTWNWLVRMPSVQAFTTRSQMVLNRAIYEQIATPLSQKASRLTDCTRTVTIAASTR